MAWTKPRKHGRHTGYYRDPQGNERSAGTTNSKKRAQQLAEDEEARIRANTWRDPDAGRMTFTEYFEEHWIKNRTLEITSRDTYKSHYKKALKPEFGDMALAAILPSTVQAWITKMQDAGVKPSTIKARFKALQTILAARRGASAMVDGKIFTNPCWAVTIPTVPERVPEIYTPDQVDALIAALPEWWRMLVWVDTETGRRWGEAIALRRRDIDFLRRRMEVSRTIIETTIANTGNGTRFLVKDYPKGKEALFVGLSEETCTMLSEYVSARGLGPDDLLFSMPVFKRHADGHRTLIDQVDRTDVWPGGLPISRAYFRKVWTKAVTEAGLPYRRRHDLRASFISWLLDDPTVAPQHAMEIAGHKQWSTTRRYARSLAPVQQKAVSAIERARAMYRVNSDAGDADAGAPA